MNLITWLAEKLGGITGKKSVPVNVDFKDIEDLIGDLYIRELAFWQAVNLISNVVSKCEFRTFVDHKEVKGREYYRLNVEPNKNQNSSEFIHKMIAKLYRNNECLIIEQNDQLFVADSFLAQPSVLYGTTFTQVQVDDFAFGKTFTQDDTLYLKLSSVNMRTLLDGFYLGYSKLITYSITAFQRSRGTKGKFMYKTLPIAGTDARKAFDDLINGRISKWLNSDIAALPLGEGQDFVELEKKTYSSESTRDIRALINDVSDFTANALLIPPALMRGDVAGISEAFDLLLTVCIDPLTDMIAEEYNRAVNGYAGFKDGTYMRIDTKTVKHVDLMSIAGSVDKLISSGVYSVNGILRALGEPEIQEAWADEHWITKNFSLAQDALDVAKGGENT